MTVMGQGILLPRVLYVPPLLPRTVGRKKKKTKSTLCPLGPLPVQWE